MGTTVGLSGRAGDNIIRAMSIRFPCPSCRQPIEIDDEWAGQSVACPYCRRVVTAPASSAWPPSDVPMASPAKGAFDAPPPPVSVGHGWGPSQPSSSTAPWALTLALTCMVLAFVGYVALGAQITAATMERLPQNPTNQQIKEAQREFAQEIMEGGRFPPNPLMTAAGIIGALCGIGGIVLAVRSLIRQEPRRGMAIAGLIISACFVVCQFPLILFATMPQMPVRHPPSESQPSGEPDEEQGGAGQTAWDESRSAGNPFASTSGPVPSFAAPPYTVVTGA